MHHLLCVCGKGSQLLEFTQNSTKPRKAPDNTCQDHGRGHWGQPAGWGEDLLVLPKHWMKMRTESRGEERRDSSVLLRIYQNTLPRCDPTVAAAA